MSDLKLGPLPKIRYVRKTVLLPEPLSEELDDYAAEHSRLYEPVEAIALIPHMLEDFLRSDRAWRAVKARKGRAGQRADPLTEASRKSDPDS